MSNQPFLFTKLNHLRRQVNAGYVKSFVRKKFTIFNVNNVYAESKADGKRCKDGFFG